MPELPEVESVARSLRPKLVGRRVLAVESSGLPLRRPIDLPRLKQACAGAHVEAVRRIGKYLLVELSSSSVLVAHLGMSGRLVFAPTNEALKPHTHARFRLDGAIDLRFIDPRRFGVLQVYAASEAAASPELSVLGLDPLERAFTVDYLHEHLRSTRRDLKAFLLDQTRIAGLGNIYVSEALYHARLKPSRRAHRVTREQAVALHAAIRKVLELGIANRGTSFSDYVDAEGASGSNQDALSVYGREGAPCRRCKSLIRRVVQGGRSTFYCRDCQK
jgi:formamidopyrimidine-DNA glycosylase